MNSSQRPDSSWPAPEPGIVDRCVCMELSFAKLAAIAKAGSLDFDALKAATGCCSGCGTCEPYVRMMLRTGKTRFAVLPQADTGDDPAPDVHPDSHS